MPRCANSAAAHDSTRVRTKGRWTNVKTSTPAAAIAAATIRQRRDRRARGCRVAVIVTRTPSDSLEALDRPENRRHRGAFRRFGSQLQEHLEVAHDLVG